jgi:hypothetical protein
MSKPLLSSINIPPSSPPIAELADCFALDFLALRAKKDKKHWRQQARHMVLQLLILLRFRFTLHLRRYLQA